jgi:hypothetical protein
VHGHNSRSGRYEEVDDSSAFHEYINLLVVVHSVGDLIVIAGNEVKNCEFFPYFFSCCELIDHVVT